MVVLSVFGEISYRKTIITYLQVTGRPSCIREIIAKTAMTQWDKHWFQALRDCCGQLCSNESFM